MAREHPQAGRAWFNLGFAELRAREADAGRPSFQHALDLAYRRRTTLYNLGCSAAQAGDADEAIRYLQRAEAAGMDLADSAPGDPDLEPLRSDPRFLQMVDRWDRKNRAEREAEKQREREKSRRGKS